MSKSILANQFVSSPRIAQVAVPVPLDKTFDYLIPPHLFPVIGGRVLIPFGPRKLVGVLIAIKTQTDVPIKNLKPIQASLDEKPLWPEALYQLLVWCSQYYQYPLGETFNNALPSALKKLKPAEFSPTKQWQLTSLGKEALTHDFKNAHQQEKAMRFLATGIKSHQDVLAEKISQPTLKALEKKQWLQCIHTAPKTKQWPNNILTEQQKPQLNQDQAIAVATINQSQGFHTYLLDGVTGSGKTEVYLHVLEPILKQQKQALILVPEIGLTPQTISRFKKRFQVPVEMIHSGLNETQRLNAWLSAKEKKAGIIIGTRSALFTPFANLGIIIVDEEHDASYKQQDSLRYHARDIAIMRAYKESIPIVLGSATPSIETLYNVDLGKYHYLNLSQRAGNAKPATHHILDIKNLYLESGLSAPLIAAMRKHLLKGEQVLLFLNRRGFSPALMCHECGWIAQCQRCDAFYTYHQGDKAIRCHHCGSEKNVLSQCAGCGSTQLISVGVGTEQLESQLCHLFPEYSVIRIDRDSTRRKGSFEKALTEIQEGKHQILIGTQMLAKGHHFPNVTLVGLLDVDAALYSSDFRASEKLAQLFIQVAGRAGRASKPGHVILQTHHPEHALLQTLVHGNYWQFSKQILKDRKMALLPPFSFLALFHASSLNNDEAMLFLQQVRTILESSSNSHQTSQQIMTNLAEQEIMVLGPMPSPLAKRAGHYRWQMVFQTATRTQLQDILSSSKAMIQALPLAKKVKWFIDIEPQDFS